jgi:hypothetical protein
MEQRRQTSLALAQGERAQVLAHQPEEIKGAEAVPLACRTGGFEPGPAILGHGYELAVQKEAFGTSSCWDR